MKTQRVASFALLIFVVYWTWPQITAPSLMRALDGSTWRLVEVERLCDEPSGTLLRRDLSTIPRTSSSAPHMGTVLQKADVVAHREVLRPYDQFVKAVDEVATECVIFHYHDDGMFLNTAKTVTSPSEFAENLYVEAFRVPEVTSIKDVVQVAGSHFGLRNYGVLETCQTVATAVALGGLSSCHVTLLSFSPFLIPLFLASAMILLFQGWNWMWNVLPLMFGVMMYWKGVMYPLVLLHSPVALTLCLLLLPLILARASSVNGMLWTIGANDTTSYSAALFGALAMFLSWATSTTSVIVRHFDVFLEVAVSKFPSWKGVETPIGLLFGYSIFLLLYLWVTKSGNSAPSFQLYAVAAIISILLSYWPNFVSFHGGDVLLLGVLAGMGWKFPKQKRPLLHLLAITLFMRMEPEVACIALLLQWDYSSFGKINVLSILVLVLYLNGYRIHICQSIGL